MQSQRGDEGQNVKFVTEVFKNLEMCSLRALRKDDVFTFSWLQSQMFNQRVLETPVLDRTLFSSVSVTVVAFVGILKCF